MSRKYFKYSLNSLLKSVFFYANLSFFIAGCNQIITIDLTKDLTNSNSKSSKQIQEIKNEAQDFKLDCSEPLTQTNQSINSSNNNLGNTTISIYVDGTLSMASYVESSIQTTRYAKTLRLLNEVASGASQVKYYKFGEVAQEINLSAYQSAFQEDFYRNNNNLPNFRVALIESAISSPSPNNLSVIVTDLYQKDTDLSNIQAKFKKDYIAQGYAVGILAVKSEFKGAIYDVGVQNASFNYTTEGKEPDKFRPFYVIVLGNYADIKSYFDLLKSQSEPFLKESHYNIFTPNIIEQQSYFGGGYKVTDNKGKKLKNINNGKVQIKTGDLPIEQINANRFISLENQVNNKINNELSYIIPLNFSDYSLNINTEKNNLKFDTQVKIFDGKNNSSLNSALNLDNLKLIDNSNNSISTNQALSFITNINSNDIDQGVYGYIVDVIPQKLEEQPWWSDWNTYDNDKDGSKTHGLTRFLRSLKSTVEQDLTSIGKFCYIVQKK